MQKGVRLDTCGSQPAAQFHDDIAWYETYDGVLIDPAEGMRATNQDRFIKFLIYDLNAR
jgi:hypothetical protein